jgi:hypothetical protein
MIKRYYVTEKARRCVLGALGEITSLLCRLAYRWATMWCGVVTASKVDSESERVLA